MRPDEIVISCNLAQLFTALGSIAAGIVAIGGAWAVVNRFINKMKKPQTDQDKRLDDHEKWLKLHDKKLEEYEIFFKNDKKRIDQIEEGNRITQQALLALLSHALDGNQIEPLKDAKSELEKYLIKK